MIPKFPNFKNLELEDKKELEEFVEPFPPYSDFNFVSMWSWNIVNEMKVSNLNGNLVVKFTDYVTNQPFYSFLGNKKVTETAEELVKLSIKENVPPILKLVPEHVVKMIDEKKFEIIEDRDHFDYIYEIDELKNFNGKKFDKKRNHISAFLKQHPKAEERLLNLRDQKIQKEIMDLFDKWKAQKMEKNIHAKLHDHAAIQRLLFGIDHFDLVNVGVYINNKLSAFYINQVISSEYVLAHMMKADTSIAAGIYAFLMKKNAEILSKYKSKFFNYEQDLGLENLRIAKTRFRPVSFLKKYQLVYKG